jgi:hypothetical protein
MEQPQKPANKINHGDMQGKDLDNRLSYCYAQYCPKFFFVAKSGKLMHNYAILTRYTPKLQN